MIQQSPFFSPSPLAKVLEMIGLGASVLLFVLFPFSERVLFGLGDSLHWADICFLLVGVFLSRRLLIGIRAHFWAYRKRIKPLTLVGIQWLIIGFVWLVVALPLTELYAEWVHGAAAWDASMFLQDLSLAFVIFTAWAGLTFLLPHWQERRMAGLLKSVILTKATAS